MFSNSKTHIMKFVVETTSIADWFTIGIPSPQRRVRRFTIGTSGAFTSS